MKIFEVNPYPIQKYGFEPKEWGVHMVENPFLKVLTALQNENHFKIEYHSLTKKSACSFSIHSIPFYFHPISESPLFFPFSSSFLVYIRENPPDIVHFHQDTAFAQVSAMILHLSNIPYIIHHHGGFIYSSLANLKTLFYSLSQGIVVNQPFTAYKMRSRKPYSLAKRFWIIPYGVDIERFKPKQGTHFSSCSPYILFVGRITRNKNVLRLVKAINNLKDEIQGIKLIIVGKIDDKAYFEEIKEYIDNHRLSRYIEYKGYVRYQNIHNVYRFAALTVLPSLYEGLGKVILESLACGTPVIALNCADGPRYILERRLSILLVSPTEIEARIKEILSNPSLYERIQKKGREVVKKRFSLSKMEKRISFLYKTVGK